MNTPLKVLIIEDSETDTRLIVRELRQAGFDVTWQRVEGEVGYIAQLAAMPDIILSDFSMPQFDGLRALEILKERELDIPFILVSGTIGEERAVNAIKHGATDYVLKDRRARLGEAVRRALREATLRKARAEAEAGQKRLTAILEAATDLVGVLDQEGKLFYLNQAGRGMLGLNPDDDLQGIILLEAFSKESRQLVLQEGIPAALRHGVWRGDTTLVTTGGQKRSLSQVLLAHLGVDGQVAYLSTIARDMTQRLQAEQDLSTAYDQLDALRKITLEITRQLDLDTLLQTLVDNAITLLNAESGGIYLYIPEADVLEWRVRAGSSKIPLGSQVRRGEGLPGRVWGTGETQVITWDRHIDHYEDFQVRAGIAVPIRWGDQLLGVINAATYGSSTRTFTERDQNILNLFADQAAVAIQNARLFAEQEKQKERLEAAVQERTRELANSRNHVAAILNSSGEAVIVFDPAGRVRSANPALTELTGYTLEEIENRHYAQLLPSDAHAAEIEDAIKLVEQGKPWRGELQIPRRDGVVFDVALTVTPFLNETGEQAGFVCVMRDVTPLKEIARMKDAFVSNVSHELRTPITGLKIHAGLIERNPGNALEYTARLTREIDRLSELIEDLLRLSRLDQGQVTLKQEPIDLNMLVKQLVHDRQPLAGERELFLSFETGVGHPIVKADPGLLGQVLSIFLTNALNYTPAGGEITVSIRQQPGDAQWLGFSVNDTGPGIAPHDIPHLSERFYRGSSGRESGISGTGLGLSIAREIIDRHGGKMTIESSGVPGEGAVFSAWLPAAGDE